MNYYVNYYNDTNNTIVGRMLLVNVLFTLEYDESRQIATVKIITVLLTRFVAKIKIKKHSSPIIVYSTITYFKHLPINREIAG